mmetsp:Transcript_24535/g.97370  ORF Transcript_24535/g.97370 Transcript_24535/m.97370 type:complete len:356 (+) Transcript_24535:188-1255(+)
MAHIAMRKAATRHTLLLNRGRHEEADDADEDRNNTHDAHPRSKGIVLRSAQEVLLRRRRPCRGDPLAVDDEVRVPRGLLVVHHGSARVARDVARVLEDLAAGAVDDRVRGARVPLHRRGEARIDVRGALGDHEEFERRALGGELRGVVLRYKRLGLGRVVRGRGDDFEVGVGFGELGGEYRLVRIVAERIVDLADGRAQTLDALVHDGRVGGGDDDDARFRRAIFYEADVDRELPVPLDELLRAIEGIDAPKSRPVPALIEGEQFVLFRHDRDARVLGGEGLADDVVGGRVGAGQRRAVGFEIRDLLPVLFRRLVVDLHDRHAGVLRDGGDVVDRDRRAVDRREATERRVVGLHR